MWSSTWLQSTLGVTAVTPMLSSLSLPERASANASSRAMAPVRIRQLPYLQSRTPVRRRHSPLAPNAEWVPNSCEPMLAKPAATLPARTALAGGTV